MTIWEGDRCGYYFKELPETHSKLLKVGEVILMCLMPALSLTTVPLVLKIKPNVKG